MPFCRVGELDQRLRQIMETFELEVLNKLCSDPDGPGLTSYDDMTMGDPQRVLENPICREQLGWKLGRGTFVKRLDELRKVRNDIAHFDPDGVSEASVDNLWSRGRVVNWSGRAYRAICSRNSCVSWSTEYTAVAFIPRVRSTL